jgi:hypothetical protein
LWFGKPQSETSNQKTAFYPAASSAAELWDAKVSPLTGNALLLNCDFALPVVPGDFGGSVAGLEFNNIGVAYNTTSSGLFTENANGCRVKLGPNPTDQKPCYEGDARLDFMTQDIQIFKTLELQDFTSFGYPKDNP